MSSFFDACVRALCEMLTHNVLKLNAPDFAKFNPKLIASKVGFHTLDSLFTNN